MFKTKRRFADTIIGNIIIMFLILTSWSLLAELFTPFDSLADTNPDLYTVIHYAQVIYQYVPAVIFMLIYKPDRKLFSNMFPGKGNTIKNILVGLLLGFGINIICALISVITGDISLYYGSPNWFYIILCIGAVIIQTGAEEFICRLFLYQHLYRGYNNPWVAITVPSLIFASLHLFNPGMDIIAFVHSIVIAVAFSLMVYVFDSFWMAWAYHFAWNYMQCIILGLPNSGLVFSLSVFKLEAATAAKSIAYDPFYGIEGSLLGLILNTVMTLILLYFAIKKRKAEKASPKTY